MMKIFAAALMAAVSFAQDEDPSAWNDMCFHCINEGNKYCVDGTEVVPNTDPKTYNYDDMLKGTCMEAFCSNAEGMKYDGETCVPDNKDETCIEAGQLAFVNLSACSYTAPEVEDCPTELVVTQEDIDSDGLEIADSSPLEYEPFYKMIKVAKGGVCKTTIKAADGVTKNVGFGASEWQEDLFVTMTRLEGSEVFDEATSQISYKNTFYWNREAKDGDLAGRVLVKPEDEYTVLFINNNKEEEQSLKLEYGAATQTVVAFTALASSLFLAYIF